MCSCETGLYSKFDRKSYFYPDMPKNYQITQYDLPLCGPGKIHISGKGFSGNNMDDKNIGITRIHLEEDVAKSTHFPGASGIDFNRAGVPLMEIVSEPDMSTADEAYAYLTGLKQIMRYGNISDCDMEKGQMRCDVNISLKPPGSEKFGTKVEIKNLNSFRAVHRSLEYEIERQSGRLDNNEKIIQETRGWNDDVGETYVMRTKENAHDYRYFPEPDLMPMTFTEEQIEEIKKTTPELPEAKRKRFVAEYGLTEYDADVLTSDRDYADYFEKGAPLTEKPKILANWIISELLRELSDSGTGIADCKVHPEELAAMVELISKGTISGKIAKKVFSEMFEKGGDPKAIVKEKGLVQLTDESEIENFVVEALDKNTSQVQQYKNGNKKVLQYFVGQVMKLSRGKANPQAVIKILKDKLG
jgi:aspartyl-tRNA(Asn)/glutamyl-tRNA(Gln) amidotransferase subunit B